MKDRNTKHILFSDGWAYFVPDGPYAAHLERNSDFTEVCYIGLFLSHACTDSYLGRKALLVGAQCLTSRQHAGIQAIRG